jgi:hypothetical protein
MGDMLSKSGIVMKEWLLVSLYSILSQAIGLVVAEKSTMSM